MRVEGTVFTLYEQNVLLAETESVSLFLDGRSILFRDASSVLRGENFLDSYTHTFPSSGRYEVRMVVRSTTGCEEALVRDVDILSSHLLVEGGRYTTSFDDLTSTHWFTPLYEADILDIDDTNPFDVGKPKRIVERPRLSSWLMGDLGDLADIGAIGDQSFPAGAIWYNSKMEQTLNPDGSEQVDLSPGFFDNEDSWLYTPEFDITAMRRPMVSFDLFYRFGSRSHGAVFQYTTDDGDDMVEFRGF